MRKEELRTYIENHESEMIEDLKSLIRIPSENHSAHRRQSQANHSAHRRQKHWRRELKFWKNTALP